MFLIIKAHERLTTCSLRKSGQINQLDAFRSVAAFFDEYRGWN